MVVSVVSSQLSDRFAVPVLLLFLAVGMLVGSEGGGPKLRAIFDGFLSGGVIKYCTIREVLYSQGFISISNCILA